MRLRKEAMPVPVPRFGAGKTSGVLDRGGFVRNCVSFFGGKIYREGEIGEWGRGKGRKRGTH